jgi:pre-mRNA-splicing factor ATP-dependent RNA helicase DHX15/PRP43
MSETNPYLAHLNTGKGSNTGRGSNAVALGSKEPLFGFVPRRVNETQVQKVMVRLYNTFCQRDDVTGLMHQEGDVNPFTKQPHSASYKKILELRKKLPVYAQMKEFYEMVSPRHSVCNEGRSESAP